MSRKYRPLAGIVLALAVSGVAFSQTQVNLHSQGKEVDFSAVPATKPAQTGAFLPLSCSPGEVFVLLSSSPGQNVYVCTSTNIWSVQAGGGGSAPNIITLTTSGPTLTIGPTCGPSAPCNVRVGATIFAFTNGMAATLTAGSGSAYIYVSSSGVLTVGHNMTVTCSGGCVAQSGVTAFPQDAYPIAIWSASAGVWTGGVDLRAPLGRDLVAAGDGLTSNFSGTTTTLSAPTHEGGFSVAFRGTDVTPGSTLYLTVPYACTITDWGITSDGTATITLWRVPDGGAELPLDSDSLSTGGFSLDTGTRIHSTTLTDLSSTSIFAFDTLGIHLLAEGAGASHVEFYLGCAR